MRTMWMALLVWAAPTQGVSTKCVIPAVEELQNTSLTCNFSEDISKLKQDFKVQFYKTNTTDSSEEILYCYWVDKKLECQVHECCEYDGHVTETLTLRVLNVNKALAGKYVCFVLPAAADSSNFCNLTLREKQTDTPGNNPASIAVPIVIVIAVIICIVIIVWRLKCKKDEEKTMKKKTCHFGPGRKKSEKVSTEGNQLLSGEAESNFPKPNSDISSKSEGHHTNKIHEPEKIPLTLEHEGDELNLECEVYPNNHNAVKAHRDNDHSVTQHGVLPQESVTSEGKKFQNSIVHERFTHEGKKVDTISVQESVTNGKEAEKHIAQESVAEGKEVEKHNAQESVTKGKVAEKHIAQESVAEGKVAEKHIAQESVAEGKVAEKHIAQESVSEGKEAEKHIAQENVAEGKVAEKHIAQESVAEGKVAEKYIAQESVAEGKVAEKQIAQESVAEGKDVRHTIAGTTTVSSKKRGLASTKNGTITHVFMTPLEVIVPNTSGKKKSRPKSKSKKSTEVINPNIIMNKRCNESVDNKDNEEPSNTSSSYKTDIKGKIPKEEKHKSSEAYKEEIELKTDCAEKTETKREKKEREKSERKEEKEKNNKEKAEQEKNEERKKMEEKAEKEKLKAGKLGKIVNNKEVEDKFQEEQSKWDECKVGVSDRNIIETDSFQQCEAKMGQEPITTPSETPQDVPKENIHSEQKVSKDCTDISKTAVINQDEHSNADSRTEPRNTLQDNNPTHGTNVSSCEIDLGTCTSTNDSEDSPGLTVQSGPRSGEETKTKPKNTLFNWIRLGSKGGKNNNNGKKPTDMATPQEP